MAGVKPNHRASPGPIANTGGMVTPETSPHASGPGNAAPAPQPTKAEQGWWSRWGSGAVHLGLDIVGMIPVVGEVADGANALIYLAEGDKVNAALSAAAMLPTGGQAATAAKWGRKSAQALESRAAKEGAQALEARAAKEGSPKISEKVADTAKRDNPTSSGKSSDGKSEGGHVNGDPKCRLLAASIYSKVPEVASRFKDMVDDKLDLFGLTVNAGGAKGAPHPSLPKGSGTWHGHVQQLEQKQRSLRQDINAYDAAKCTQPKVPGPVRDLAYHPIPAKPGGTLGYPFSALPK